MCKRKRCIFNLKLQPKNEAVRKRKDTWLSRAKSTKKESTYRQISKIYFEKIILNVIILNIKKNFKQIFIINNIFSIY